MICFIRGDRKVMGAYRFKTAGELTRRYLSSESDFETFIQQLKDQVITYDLMIRPDTYPCVVIFCLVLDVETDPSRLYAKFNFVYREDFQPADEDLLIPALVCLDRVWSCGNGWVRKQVWGFNEAASLGFVFPERDDQWLYGNTGRQANTKCMEFLIKKGWIEPDTIICRSSNESRWVVSESGKEKLKSLKA
jgi:hypothetical protein